jgi:hypothetical protein
MSDLSLNSDFSVHLDDTNDLAVVSKRDKFEQDVSFQLTRYLQESLLGTIDRDTIEQKLRLQVNRVARQNQLIEGVDGVSINSNTDQPNTLEVRVVYNSGESFTLNLSE